MVKDNFINIIPSFHFMKAGDHFCQRPDGIANKSSEFWIGLTDGAFGNVEAN